MKKFKNYTTRRKNLCSTLAKLISFGLAYFANSVKIEIFSFGQPLRLLGFFNLNYLTIKRE